MKKRNLLCVLGAVAALTLASCNGNNGGGNNEPPVDPFNAEELVSTFADSVDTTVKLTYTANYDVNVTREGGINEGFYRFIHEIRATSVVEMDLGEDLYIEVTKNWQDTFVSEDVTVTESLLYKKDGKYYYQTNTTPAVEVAEADALNKVAEILSSTTYEDAGGVTLDALLYNSLDKNYELSVVALTDTFMADELVDPVYSKNANNGLHVEYKPEYIGYKTDMGMSDFGNPTDGYAAVVTIDTNDKGYVTSFNEQYNTAILDFAIMEPKPRVTITGSRNFTATYGEEITKLNGLAVATTAKYSEANGGTFAVKTCASGDFGNMADVENNGALEVGKLLCVKPTANEGYEVASVSVNGNTTTLIDPAMAGGYYCFNVVEGDNNIVVTFKATAVAKTATAKYVQTVGGSYVVKSCVMGDFGNMSDVENGGALVVGNILCVKVTANEGYEVASVSVNGVLDPMLPPAAAGGFYCYKVVEGENNIVVNFKKVESTGTHVKYNQVAGGSYVVKYCTMGDFANMTELANGDSVEAGKILCIKPTAAAGYEVESVSVNGVAEPMLPPQQAGGFYCFTVAEGANEVVVTYKELTVAKYSQVQNGTFEVKTCVMGQFTNMSAVENNGAIVVDDILCIKVTPAEGYVVDTVSVNGVAEPMLPPQQAGGFYCYKITEGHNVIVVTFKAQE